jgi:hypothetical protein
VLALLGAYLTGDAETALDGLDRFAMDSVHRRITADGIWRELERRDIRPSDLSRDMSLASARVVMHRLNPTHVNALPGPPQVAILRHRESALSQAAQDLRQPQR